MPQKREQERLDVMHHMLVRLIGGRFWLAPIDEDKIQNVLDIGTGTGIRTCHFQCCVIISNCL